MEYQKIINFLDYAPNQPSKFRTKDCVEINIDVGGTYSTSSEIILKTSLLKPSLCNYSDAYITFKGKISIKPIPPPAVNPNNKDKVVVLKNCGRFTDCISEINNTQIDNAKDIDVVMACSYNLIKYSDNYSKTTGRLWQYYRDKPVSDANDVIADFPASNNNNALFKLKQKTKTGKTVA